APRRKPGAPVAARPDPAEAARSPGRPAAPSAPPGCVRAEAPGRPRAARFPRAPGRRPPRVGSPGPPTAGSGATVDVSPRTAPPGSRAEDLLPEEDADLGEEIRRRRGLVGEAHAVRVGPDVGARVEQPLPQRRAMVGEAHLVGAELAALLIGQAETDDLLVGVGAHVEGEYGAGDFGRLDDDGCLSDCIEVRGRE